MSNKTSVLILVAFAATLLSACAKEPPKCSDEATLSLVRKIILDKTVATEGLTEKEIQENMKIEFPRASAFDEKIKKYTCQARLISGGTYQLPIIYESQLDDKNQHIVSVAGISPIDLLTIQSGVIESVKKNRVEKNDIAKPAEASTTPKSVEQSIISPALQTSAGNLEIKQISETEKAVVLSGKVLLKKEDEFLYIVKLFKMKDHEVVLIRDSMGGSGTIDSFFFIVLKPGSPPYVSKQFSGQSNEINPIQKGDQIIIDLGFNNGKHEVLTYSNGQYVISEADRSQKNKAKVAADDDCNYLYNEIYTPYSRDRKCDSAPEEIGGMSTVRGYNSIGNNPQFNLKVFQEITVASCKSGKSVPYSEFRKKVCGY